MVKVINACVQGALHKHKGIQCQDSHKIWVSDNLAVIAVADGHGSESCPFSKTGADIAVNVFHAEFQKYYGSKYNLNGIALMADLRRGCTDIARSIDLEWKRRVERSFREQRKRRESADVKTNPADRGQIRHMYGTTLLGLVLTKDFYFAFQLGDGDILLLNDGRVKGVVKADKLLGVETHSLSRENAHENAVTAIGSIGSVKNSLFMLATDGFANSYPSDLAFHKTCLDYYDVIKEHGTGIVQSHLKEWLDETSKNGSGDDITACFVSFGGV
jgi:serine/threonine protein phosphatase PrpC